MLRFMSEVKLRRDHDDPEAVQDGIHEALTKLDWKLTDPSKNDVKMIILLSD